MSGVEAIIGLAATGAGVIQLADYGLRLARMLKRFSREFGFALSDMERLSQRLGASSRAIGLAQGSLDQYCAVGEVRQLPVLASISVNGYATELKGLSLGLLDKLSDARKQVTAMRRTRFPLKAILKWILNKPLVLEGVQEMDSVMLTLQLVISSVHLQHSLYKQKESPPTSDEEKAKLQGTIQYHTRVIGATLEATKDLRAEMESLGDGDAVLLAARHLQAIVEDLSQRIIREQTSVQPPSSTSSPTPPPPASPPVQPPTPGPSRQTRPAAGRRPHRDSSEHSNDRASISAANLISLDLDSIRNLPTESWNFAPENGRGTSQPRDITTRLLRGLAQNIISFSYAKKFDLKITPHASKEEGLYIRLGKGRPVRTIGRVVLGFMLRSTRQRRERRPVEVECDVCDSYSWDFIVLGDPFLQMQRSLDTKAGISAAGLGQ